MRSSFFEYQVASSALFAARAGLETASHNIANGSTKGYSRQVAELRASRPMPNYGKGMVGTGATFVGVNQIRNVYLDKKYWSESAVLGEYSQKRTQLGTMESLLSEINETGLHSQFSLFFDRLEDLTAAASQGAFRRNVVQLGQSMTTQFKHNYASLQKQQRDIDDEIVSMTSHINNLGQQISTLNKKIYEYEITGDNANDLRDERARVVDELSLYVNVTVSEKEFNEDVAQGNYPGAADRNKSDKRYAVYINGNEFVNHYKINTLETRPRRESINGTMQEYYNNPEDAPGLHDIYWSQTGSKFNIYHTNLSGELKALVDLRDGNNGNTITDMKFLSYTSATKTLEMDLGEGRVDLHPHGGKFTITNAKGRQTDIAYTSYSYDVQTGKASFVLAKDHSEFNTPNYFDDKNVSYGENSSFKGIPYYLSRLNTLARTFAKSLNEGKYLNGETIDGITGHIDGFDDYGKNDQTLFLTYTDTDGKEVAFSDTFNIYNLTAENFVVNQELLTDPKKLVTSKDKNTGQDNNDVILGFIELQHNNSLFKEGNILDYISGMTTELAIDVKQATLFETSYSELRTTIDNQRMSVSGVSTNEEIMDMIKFQTQYRSAAKLMSIIDSIYDMTINNMGLM